MYNYMVRRAGLLLTALLLASATVWARQTASLADLLDKATAYVSAYEQTFSLLVSEEHYVQQIRRPVMAGSNLSRANPGGGIQGGDVVGQRILRSDYLLVHLGAGAGWMPFRDVFEVNTGKVRDREDRLTKLFLSNDDRRFELADRIMAESTRHNIGNVSRTINIPTLAMMFVHPRVRDRFTFTLEAQEMVAGRRTQRLQYRETARPTLIKTTRGRDLPLDGQLWVDIETGATLKTKLNAMDPVVRAVVEVTFRKDEDLAIWVPEQMDEYYKANSALDEIFATATYSNVRRFQVNTSEKLGKPPGP